MEDEGDDVSVKGIRNKICYDENYKIYEIVNN